MKKGQIFETNEKQENKTEFRIHERKKKDSNYRIKLHLQFDNSIVHQCCVVVVVVDRIFMNIHSFHF